MTSAEGVSDIDADVENSETFRERLRSESFSLYAAFGHYMVHLLIGSTHKQFFGKHFHPKSTLYLKEFAAFLIFPSKNESALLAERTVIPAQLDRNQFDHTLRCRSAAFPDGHFLPPAPPRCLV
ncbi:MAG: hypothetical protein IPH31_19050 [Lewinellaceae bacterium]|nr:hypothetical protein [Lewinellaceae bacterium]